MYITPQTNIRLLSNCPCDPDYTNTIHWYDKSSQASYFLSLTKYNLNAYSYQRYEKNKIRVEINADNLYDVNYMMFQNTAFGNKWFYAFVTDIEYINNITSEITYEIDDMQSWYLDYTLNRCFVERQHSLTDEIGDNILPENVELGEYIYNSYSDISAYTIDGTSTHFDPKNLVTVLAIVDVDENSSGAEGSVFEKVYTGATLWVFNNSDANFATAINSKINEYVQAGKPDSIVSIYTAPRQAVEFVIDSSGTKITGQTAGIANPYNITFPAITTSSTLDGYTPKNKKMYTYPYNYFNIDNGEGSNLALRYELFNNTNKLHPQISAYCNLLAPVSCLIQPRNYKSIETVLHNESIKIDNFPLCCWSVDAWQAWISQNQFPILGMALGAGLTAGAVAAGVALPPLAPFAAAVGTATYAIGNGYKAAIHADISKGNFAGSNISVANGLKSFFVGRVSITANYAEVIDNFFTRFGYTQNKLMQPVRDARAKWTYIKTIGCTISGTIPANSEKHIQEIFDRGITFWINPSEVGHYELNNAVSQG